MTMMKKPSTPTPDEQLADYTDRLLAGEPAPDEGAAAPDPELAALKDTVRRLQGVLADPAIDPAARGRIHARLQGEFHRQYSARKQSWREKPSMQWGLVFVLAVALVAVGLILPDGEVTPGAAGGAFPMWIPAAVLLVVLVGLLLISRGRKK